MPRYLVTITETYYVDADDEGEAERVADGMRPCYSEADAVDFQVEELPE